MHMKDSLTLPIDLLSQPVGKIIIVLRQTQDATFPAGGNLRDPGTRRSLNLSTRFGQVRTVEPSSWALMPVLSGEKSRLKAWAYWTLTLLTTRWSALDG